MLTYNLDNRGGQPKYYYLYTLIKDDIQRGSIAAGSKLPSKRELAEHLGVSVITVDAAYTQLVDEGYVFSKERSGFFVGQVAAADVKEQPGPIVKLDCDEAEQEPAGDTGFRYSALTKIMREVISDYGTRLLSKPPHYGCPELRNAIAEYLLRYRGMVAQPNRIIIGSGSEQLYGNVVQLLGRDKVYGLEYPSYEKIHQVYEAQGAKCEFLSMDKDGITSKALRESKADVLHVTPFHSFPTGISAPASKRYEYLTWAGERGGYIIEDDFDSEFAPNRKPLETMFSMDRNGCVIYINTFSHSLAPSMRMGYMILPDSLIEQYEQRLGFYTCSVPLFDQYVLAEFISRGFFERHLNRVRRRLKHGE
ncbi:MAG: PLP-dependent aminotransferase family protein [Oscillospiraceae bacterium]